MTTPAKTREIISLCQGGPDKRILFVCVGGQIRRHAKMMGHEKFQFCPPASALMGSQFDEIWIDMDVHKSYLYESDTSAAMLTDWLEQIKCRLVPGGRMRYLT